MNRRHFLKAIFAAPIVAAVAPVLLKPKPPIFGTIGAIDRATFSFWRNRQLETLDVTRADVFDAAEYSWKEFPHSYPFEDGKGAWLKCTT